MQRRRYRKSSMVETSSDNVINIPYVFQFKEISEAYQILSDPKLRKRYNENGAENGVKPEGGFGKLNITWIQFTCNA